MLDPIVKKYRITLLTWLHIWWSDDGLKIGGIDSPVIKNPLSGAPYIPGSSIKWKMRALIEMVDFSEELSLNNFEPVQSPNSLIANIFGAGGKNTNIPSKILFDDFTLTPKWEEVYNEKKADFFEDKAENSIQRFWKGNANPRHIERIPAGVVFEGKIILLPHQGEESCNCDEQTLENMLKRGISLLENNYLGGGGSRGNGRIRFEEIL